MGATAYARCKVSPEDERAQKYLQAMQKILDTRGYVVIMSMRPIADGAILTDLTIPDGHIWQIQLHVQSRTTREDYERQCVLNGKRDQWVRDRYPFFYRVIAE